MDTMVGKSLLNQQKELVKADVVLKETSMILYFFSASWSPPCELFLEQLKELHQAAKKRNFPLEIIYISFDYEKCVMMESFAKFHGDWFAIPFEDDPTREELRWKYDITGIPTLLVVQRDGKVITREGKKEIEKIGINTLITWTP